MIRLVYLLLLSLIVFAIGSPSIASEKEKDNKEEAAEKKEEKSNKIYAIKDRDGNIIGYTDDPLKGSDEIKIRKGTEYKPPEQETVWTKVEPKVVEETVNYTNFAIASPSNDATIRNNAGTIQIALDIRPALQPGHKVQILMDGKELTRTTGVIYSAANVDRGSHTITANILDGNNKAIKSASAVTVHLHRAIAGR